MSINRRRLLQLATGFTLASGFTSITPRHSLSLEVPKTNIEIRVWTAKGQPLESKSLDQLYFLTLDDEPRSELPRKVESGILVSQCPDFPFIIALRLPVIGFGEVVLYGDNNGKGYTTADFPLNLNLAFAQSRLHRVKTYIAQQRKQGIDFPDSILARLQRGQQYLNNAKSSNSIVSQVGWCNLSLVETLWGGEIAVFTEAKQKIAQQASRPDFLFGSGFGGYNPNNPQYTELFKQLFNFATIHFYWNSFEPERGQKNFLNGDRKIDWLHAHNITPKGHPLVYFHEAGTPNWLKDKPYSEVKQEIYNHVLETTAYYQDRIPYYDIINEANNIPWANELEYNREQFLELTQIAATASAKGYPQVKRIINHCCAWAENVAYGKLPQDSPYQYLKRCITADIPCEIIGLQVYYPHQDMFEINRFLDRYSTLGKPIHITELGVSSAATIDEASQLQEPRGLWHKPWSESIQADWIEQFYTICYSKPYIKAISWWDFADKGNFWPHGGLLDSQMQPKQSFYRLSRLIRSFKINRSIIEHERPTN